MEILGIGPLELLFIILIALLILGPKDLVRSSKNLGQWLYKFVRSDTWKTVRQASDKVRSLPNELMREAGIEEMKKAIDSGVIQPINNARKSLESLDSEMRVDGSVNPEKDITDGPPTDLNKIAPPFPNKEEGK